MIDFDRLRIRFKQFGGFRLAWEYVRLGLLWVIIKELFRCVVHKKSFKSVYPEIGKVVDPILIEKYKASPHPSPVGREKKLPELNVNGLGKTYVWTCWLQGWDKAPELAKACLASLRKNLSNVQIVELDDKNYTQWVYLPDYIVEKYKKGHIPAAMFSDMLRLQLLAEYGGIWIDSTVLCSHADSADSAENKRTYSPSWQDIVNADLFVFQYTKPGRKWSGALSNWFVASKKGNPFIMTLRDMLFAYWKDYDVALEYYICHLFFNEVAKIYPEQIAKMPYGWSTPSISLGAHLDAKFNEKKWQQFTSQVHWHKMSYRKEKELKKNPNNYYSYIIKEYLS